MPVRFTPSQKQLIVVLAEPMLRREGVSISNLPSSASAAERLGWSMSKFNRKLDHVCEKLDRMGVQGLRGAPGKLAMNRRARLVEYAVVAPRQPGRPLPSRRRRPRRRISASAGPRRSRGGQISRDVLMPSPVTWGAGSGRRGVTTIWKIEDDDEEIEGLDDSGRPDPAYAASLGLIRASMLRRAAAFAVDLVAFWLVQLPLLVALPLIW